LKGIFSLNLNKKNVFSIVRDSQDKYLMAKITSAPDVMDNDYDYYSAMLQAPPVQPGTKEGHTVAVAIARP
jgi:hypothetical protein